ncbi:ATP-binding protein [Smaragdicoccus niigatensis]|uniref:sensor histidine kinase n=1 Tax=Smaragdicoccus niigatensis TaxID=359359 RepID=UPI00138AE4EF|nr:ATP-binding protein [Smaragdicoccus niigatensis]
MPHIEPRPVAISPGVIIAALIATPGMFIFIQSASGNGLTTASLFGSGWFGFAVPAALLLDRDPRTRLGWTLAMVPLVPVVVFFGTAIGHGELPSWAQLETTWRTLGIAIIVAVLAAIGWAVGYAPDRLSVRRLTWLVVWDSAFVAVLVVVWMVGDAALAADATMFGLWVLSGVIAVLGMADQLRPIDEPLVDVAAGVIPLVIGAGVGVLARLLADNAGMRHSEVPVMFAAVSAAALSLPALLAARKVFLERRYGRGTLTPDDVAAITADLHRHPDPRLLLGKAATMVATASGHRDVRIVLEEGDEVPSGTVVHHLVVGGDHVGDLVLVPVHPEGPEFRQIRTVDQLIPTVALVAKAVGLAVEADHARRDAVRQREAERARILGDLHDGVGPVLAGMSMKVQARLRSDPAEWLRTLAADLSECRGDLRRIVSGLTPSALHDGNLEAALHRLVGSFDGADPAVSLDVSLDVPVPADAAVAIYRTAAEGITNAMRHARAQSVSIRVEASRADVSVTVVDDGIGGPIAPGIGLTSLQKRAEELGGRLVVESSDEGTTLWLTVPLRERS